ncbi:MAG: PH domain-containing protein [Pseudomonadota bacterium]
MTMSGYVEKTLGTGEDIEYRAHFNWTYSFWPLVWLLISITPIVILAYAQFSAGLPWSQLAVAWYIFFAGLLVGVIQFLGHMIVLWTTEIVVTTFRFVYKTGLVSRNTQEVSLNKIEEITLQQSIWGRIFDYGSLTLRGTGVGVITLPNIDEPIKVRRVIENAKSNLRGVSSPSEDDED